MNIDNIDRKILNALQKDARQSIADLAQIVGLSASACHRRVGLLEKANIIQGYSARLNGGELGYRMEFFVEVTLESQNETVLQEFEAAALARKEVLECYLTTGNADYLLKVAAQDTQSYERIYRRTIAAMPHVTRIQSSLVMKTVKPWSGYPA